MLFFTPIICFYTCSMKITSNRCAPQRSSVLLASKFNCSSPHIAAPTPKFAIKQPQFIYKRHRQSSMAAMTSDIVNAPPENSEHLVQDAVAWCSQHGLVYGAGLAEVPVALVPAPVSLVPVSYPKETFLLAKRAATAFNYMIDAVSRDEAYLRHVLEPAARYDDFTAKLLEVYAATTAARTARAGRDLSLAINRSDYMLHAPTGKLLQVELNTIASSFGCLSTLVTQMHRYVLQRAGAPTAELDRLPANEAMYGIADALGAASAAHGVPDGVMLMVVQSGERNAYDQQWLQLTLWERHGVNTLRRTLGDIAARGKIDGAGQLTIDGHVASVVYFRAGYTPDDYPTDAEWAARELIECSNAATCPSVALQLAGSKKVQQDLAAEGTVERFAASAEDAALMRTFFAGLWGLDALGADPPADAAVADALDHPENYVLKPQREGGGNNLYGEALRERLQTKTALGDLILMQRIHPPNNRAIMVRVGEARVVDTLSELGIYGTFLRRGSEVLVNREVGHLVRTKAATSDEGGVAAGFAVLDSPLLV